MGKSTEEISTEFVQSLVEIHVSLSYYFVRREMNDIDIKKDQAIIKFKTYEIPSKLLDTKTAAR